MTDANAAIVLGSTGTIGVQQVEHYGSDPTTHVVALAAGGRSLPLIAQQAVRLGAYGIALHEADPQELHDALDRANEAADTDVRPEVLIGPQMVAQAAAAGVGTVVNAIRGIHGLPASVAALETGAELAVANTETLLSAPLLQQYLPAGQRLADRLRMLHPQLRGVGKALQEHDVAKVILTTRSQESQRGRRRNSASRVNAFSGFTAAQALLELRAVTEVPIEVFEHDGPISSIVELSDGRCLLNPRGHLRSTWSGSNQWSFKEARLVAVDYAQAVASEGGTYPIVLHTANTEAVNAYLRGEIGYEAVENVIAAVMDAYDAPGEMSIEGFYTAVDWAEQEAQRVARSLKQG